MKRIILSLMALTLVSAPTIALAQVGDGDLGARREAIVELEARTKELQALRREQAAEKAERAELLRRQENAEQLEIRERAFVSQQKEMLEKTIDTLIAYMNQIKDRAHLLQNTALKARINAQAEAMINDLLAGKRRIDNATTSSDIKGIVSTIQTLRNTMQGIGKVEKQDSIRSLTLLAQINRFEDRYVTSARERAEKISTVLNDLESQGYNVDAAKALLAAGEDRIKTVQDQLAKLRQEIEGGATLNAETMTRIRLSLNGAKDNLKAVYDVFRDIANHVNNL